MKFSSQFKVWQACGESGRYRMDCAKFAPGDKDKPPRILVTNGRILAVVPVEDSDGDTPNALVSGDSLKAASGKGAANPAEVRVTLSGLSVKLHLRVGEAATDRPEGDFPNVERCIPTLTDGAFSVQLSPKLLQRLADAIGASEGVCLTFSKDPNTPILVKPLRGDQGHNAALGIIMPISLEA